MRRRGGFAVQGLRRRIQGPDPALYRADGAAGPLLRGRFPGHRYKPFATGGDPSQARFAVEGVVAQGVSDERQQDRRELLQNSIRSSMPCRTIPAGEPAGFGETGVRTDPGRRRQGLRSVAGKGRNARPLRPQHVRAVVPGGAAAGGARRPLHHHQLSAAGTRTSRISRPCAGSCREMDKGMSSLLQDLADRGLLESTIVWWSGEFGRKPKVDWDAPWNGGRNHWGNVFSALVAGGGFKGGHVVGVLRRQRRGGQGAAGLSLRRDRQHVRHLGIDPEAKLPHPHGLDGPCDCRRPETAPLGGRLRENHRECAGIHTGHE